MNRKRKKILRTMVNVFCELVMQIMFSFIEEFDKIGIILEIIYPVFLVYCSPNIAVAILFSMVMLFICRYIQSVGKAVNRKGDKGFPMPDRRYTEMDKDGFIGMKNEDDFPDMIQYLYELENYYQKRSRLK